MFLDSYFGVNFCNLGFHCECVLYGCFKVSQNTLSILIECIGKGILILMLFSIALENYFFHTLQGTKFLYLNVSSCFDVNSILFVLSKKRKKYSSCMFWIEPKQKNCWEKIETIV
jgi:hypothetical protein